MKDEQALSEVIGFLMIVSLLGILFSMYLLYVVPIQGRDAEIAHMKYITQEFIGLKADIDGLIINDKINMPISRSFELGTLSSVGKGSFSIMPMSSFIEAAGTLMVNEQNDHLTVTVVGDFIDDSGIWNEIDQIKDINPLEDNEFITDQGLERFKRILLTQGNQKLLFWNLDRENPLVEPFANPDECGKLDTDDDNNNGKEDDIDGENGGDATFGRAFYFGDRLYILKTKLRPYIQGLEEYEGFDPNSEKGTEDYKIPHYRDLIWSYPIDLVIEGYSVNDAVNPRFIDFLNEHEDTNHDGKIEDPDYLTNLFRDTSRPNELDPYINFNEPVYTKTLIENLQNGQYYTINILENNELIPRSLEDYVKMHPDWLDKIRNTLIKIEYNRYNPDINAHPLPPQMITTYLDPDAVIDGQSVNPDRVPPRIGSLQYWSQNRYWVNQELLYEMGGLFLKQSDGISIMLVPSISVSEVIPYNNPDNPVEPSLKVTMTNIRITDTEDVSGSLSAQIFSKVDNIAQNLIYGTNLPPGVSPDGLDNAGNAIQPMDWKLREGAQNSQFLWIKYTPEIDMDRDRQVASVRLWQRGFDQIYTIAAKSMSNAQIDPRDYIDVVTIIDDNANDPKRRYSANFFVGHDFDPFAQCGGDGACTLDELEQSVQSYLWDNNVLRPHQPFILDYKEAEISMVMQSGAL